MTNKKRNLGRGLNSLLGDTGEDYADLENLRTLKMVGIAELAPSPYQPRQEFDAEAIADLVESIREKGVLQPLLVRRQPDNPDLYEIIAGERRWRAAQQAQLEEVPVIVKDFSDREALEVALVENLQRQDLSSLEEADGYKRLMDEFSHTQEDLAKAVGKSRSHVANTLRLLNLPGSLKAMLTDGALTAGHARALLNADNPEDLASQVVSKGLNVRQTEKLAQTEGNKKPRVAKVKEPKDPDILALESDLTGTLGLAVVIKPKGEAGELTIRYGSLEQLDDVIARLQGNGISTLDAEYEEEMESYDAEDDGLPAIDDDFAMPEVAETDVVEPDFEEIQEDEEPAFEESNTVVDSNVELEESDIFEEEGDAFGEDQLSKADAELDEGDIFEEGNAELEESDIFEESNTDLDESDIFETQDEEDEDDWATGLDQPVIGLEEDEPEEEDDSDTVDDASWSAALQPDMGEEPEFEAENMGEEDFSQSEDYTEQSVEEQPEESFESADFDPVEEESQTEDDPDDDWAVGLDQPVIGLEEEEPEEEDDGDTVDDASWSAALQPDMGEEPEFEAEDIGEEGAYEEAPEDIMSEEEDEGSFEEEMAIPVEENSFQEQPEAGFEAADFAMPEDAAVAEDIPAADEFGEFGLADSDSAQAEGDEAFLEQPQEEEWAEVDFDEAVYDEAEPEVDSEEKM